ncbi:MAG: SCP2 sterol-binding domain-containing protein [Anaerolineales bacterium]|nr:SCP2 sterol-binding domain-containing protein [Anaerolineales bacterium]
MSAVFPSPEWLNALSDKLNSDKKYAQIAKKWEGDLLFFIQPDDRLTETLYYYLDLWHGTCRKVEVQSKLSEEKPAFILKAPYGNFRKILLGELDPMQAMMTRKLQVEGSMAYMMRNVPVVLDFVRCAREATTETY